VSILSPTTRAEVERSAWVLGGLLVTPILVQFFVRYSTYLAPDTLFETWIAGGLLGIVAGVALVWRTNRLIARGLHPRYPAGSVLPLKVLLVLPIAMALVMMMWAYALIAAFLWYPGRPTLERTFTVAETKACKRRCWGCRHTAHLAGWPGRASSSVCTHGLEPPIQVGDRVVVRGHFSSLGVHVESVRLASVPSNSP
jgi:hypothetical protein